jgi:lipopolysaccharide export system protein LptA
MRITEAARYARWSAVVALALTMLVAGLYAFRAWQARQSAKAAPPPVPPTVQQRSTEFSFSKVEGNQTQFVVRASRATEFREGGRSLLEDVWVTAFGDSGARSDQLRTRTCEYFPQASNITCAEEVRIDLQSADRESDPSARAVQIITSGLSFNYQTGIARTSQPVQFRFSWGQGKAVGLYYNSRGGELRLLREVEIVLQQPPAGAVGTAAPRGEPTYVSSQELLYQRQNHVLYLRGSGRARQGQRELLAGMITLELDATLRAQRVVARDHPRLQGLDGASPFLLTADELVAGLGPASQPERVVATGNVRMEARPADRRDQLQAAWSQLDLIPETGQPHHLLATGEVVVLSNHSDGSLRRLRTSALEVHFASEGEGPSRIERASALAATLQWQASPSSSATPDLERMHLAGQHLDGAFDQASALRELRGTGGVQVQHWDGSGPPVTSTSRELLARFGPDGVWSTVDQSGNVRLANASGHAQADRAHFDRAGDSVDLRGSVILSDASSRTRAQQASFRQAAHELRAEGSVATSEVPASDPGSESTHISSDRLVADTASGRAVYSGGARMWQGDSVIQADAIDLDRSAQTLIATGKVRAVFPQMRQPAPGITQWQFWHAEAGRMIYKAAEHSGRLEHDAKAQSADGSMRADRMDLFFAPKAAPARSAPPGVRQGLGATFADQALERAVASGSVRVESGERIATGDRGDYGAAQGKFVLSGGRPKLWDRFGNSTTGRQLTFFFADDRIVIDSEEGSRTLTLHRVEK